MSDHNGKKPFPADLIADEPMVDKAYAKDAKAATQGVAPDFADRANKHETAHDIDFPVNDAPRLHIDDQATEHSAASDMREPLQMESAFEKNIHKDADDKPRKRSSTVRNPFIILGNFALVVIGVILIGALSLYYIGRSSFESPGPSQEAQTVLIRPGAGIREIATMMEKQGIIREAGVFVGAVGFLGNSNKLKAGEYEVPARASMRDVMDVLISGKPIEYSLTIPEGLTVQQVLERIKNNDMLTGALPNELPPEGSLMTDTVKFQRGTARIDIVRRLMDGQKKLVETIWANRAPDLPLKNINEMVTLASIVEKETGIAFERPMVASVFYNRLAKNMRLQSDPTFLYGLYGGAGKPADKRVTRDDRMSDTPYNTYRINGLPPTPIANPGRDALEAVAHPPKSDALYFVADGTGGHVFSKTLDEHNAHVAKWREFRRNSNDASINNDSSGEQGVEE